MSTSEETLELSVSIEIVVLENVWQKNEDRFSVIIGPSDIQVQ